MSPGGGLRAFVYKDAVSPTETVRPTCVRCDRGVCVWPHSSHLC